MKKLRPISERLISDEELRNWTYFDCPCMETINSTTCCGIVEVGHFTTDQMFAVRRQWNPVDKDRNGRYTYHHIKTSPLYVAGIGKIIENNETTLNGNLFRENSYRFKQTSNKHYILFWGEKEGFTDEFKRLLKGWEFITLSRSRMMKEYSLIQGILYPNRVWDFMQYARGLGYSFAYPTYELKRVALASYLNKIKIKA